MSTAEAELYELIAAYQLGLGIQAWASEVQASVPQAVKVDNTAALGLASTAPGTWKTRHLRARARFLRQEVLAQRVTLHHEPGEGQPADLGTKPVPAPRLSVLRELWNMVTAEDFGQGQREGRMSQIIVAPRLEAVKIMALMVVLTMAQGAKAERAHKNPTELDGSVEFYVCVGVCGVALVAIWELVKKIMGWLLGAHDETAVKKGKRLLRIRDQTARALHQELKNLEPEAAPRTSEAEVPRTATSSESTSSATSGQGAFRVDAPNEAITDSQAARLRLDFRCLPKSFVMSEHGDRVHVHAGCYGLRHANQAKLRIVKYCQCCAEHYPLYYRRPQGDPLLG